MREWSFWRSHDREGVVRLAENLRFLTRLSNILVKIKLDSPPIAWLGIQTPGLMLRQAFGAPSPEFFDSL